MISTDQLSLAFGGRTLFENVNIKFTPGNCYGLIGANGAGKSTFLRCLSGEQDPSAGSIKIPRGLRISVLKQDHFAFDDKTALMTVIMGHEKLYSTMVEKDAIYALENFSDEDGMRAAELEAEFADMAGWEAETNAAQLLCALDIPTTFHNTLMNDLSDSQKVRVLLAQALFGDPDILLLDEPTNHLDVDSVLWLEEFLLNFKNTVVVVSHDRHFLNKVCTHIADVDFQKVTLFSGNYTFWYETSQMALRQTQAANRKKSDQIKELQAFVARFSANASKSKQATSRKAQLDKISLEDIKPSSRKYPYVVFKSERKLGKDVLFIDKLSAIGRADENDPGQGKNNTLFNSLNITVGMGERVAVVGSDAAVGTFFEILAGVREPYAGSVHWGHSVNRGYLPKDNEPFFNSDKNLIEWLAQYAEDAEENFVRSFLGRMLFSGEEVKKSARVLSGGEKMRCMLARMMLSDPNTLLLNGPTNHLDLESITALNNGLLDFSGTMLFSSHDTQFVSSLATRILEIGDKEIFDMHMTYDEYLADEARLVRVGRAT